MAPIATRGPKEKAKRGHFSDKMGTSLCWMILLYILCPMLYYNNMDTYIYRYIAFYCRSCWEVKRCGIGRRMVEARWRGIYAFADKYYNMSLSIVARRDKKKIDSCTDDWLPLGKGSSYCRMCMRKLHLATGKDGKALTSKQKRKLCTNSTKGCVQPGCNKHICWAC